MAIQKEPAKPSHVSHALRNIIIGIITTVAASTIVWWLGFSENKADEAKKKKEATYKAWETLDKYETMYAETMDDLNCRMLAHGGSSLAPEDAESIIRQITNNITTLADVKNEPDIDIDIKALVQRRITYFTAIKSEIQKMTDGLMAIPAGEGQAEAQNRVLEKYKFNLNEISVAEQKPIYDLMTSIEKKYGEPLKGTRVRLDIDTKNIVGYWKIDSTNVFDIQAGGILVSKLDNKMLRGFWQMNGDTVTLDFGDGDKGHIEVTSLTKKVLSYTVLEDHSFHSACRN